MSGDGERREALAARLQWFLHGDVSTAWLRPRREQVPLALFSGQVALFLLHTPVGRISLGSRCATLSTCREQLARTAAEEPTALLVALGLHLLAVAVAYLLAAGVTALAARRFDLASGAPALFDTDDGTLTALSVVVVAWLLSYLAGTYGAAYTLVGVVALYVLFFPPLVATAALWGLGTVPASLPAPLSWLVTAALVVVLLVGVPAAEVLWLYALAHGAVSALRRGGTATD